MNPMADTIKNILKNSGNIVVISGINVVRETGLNGTRAEHIAYEIEEKYGYSNDEIISSAFFSRRSDIFYDYYKNIILNLENPKPTAVHKAVSKLQQEGKISAIVTRTVYELYEKAGCEDVIRVHGSAEKNVCPVCGKVFGMDYIKQANHAPKCDVCQMPLRPGFTLLGEKVDNGKVTESCNAVENANVLLIIGAAIRTPTCQHVLRYYDGCKMILINTQEEAGDERADYQLYGNLSELLSYVTSY